MRNQDPDFASPWDEAEEVAADAFEAEAWRGAVDRTPKPVVSAGKVVRDDDGASLATRRYSNHRKRSLITVVNGA